MSSSMYLSQRFLELEPSATMAMNAKAKKLKDEGKNVISFSVGEPDFKTPRHICEAAKKAIDDGLHGYTAVAGLPELRRAVAASLKRNIGIEYTPGAGRSEIYDIFKAAAANRPRIRSQRSTSCACKLAR